MTDAASIGAFAATTPASLATYQASQSLTASGSQSSSHVSASDMAQIDKTSQDFEAVFLSQMMGTMFEGDEITSYFGGGSTGEIYKSFMMNEYGKAIAKSGGIGIAAQVKTELLKLQEVAT